jgi:hypothetical protein
LYGVACTRKSTPKTEGAPGLKIPTLGCRWFSNLHERPPSEYKWRLLVRAPDRIAEEKMADAGGRVREK